MTSGRWTKPTLNLVEYGGSSANNLILMKNAQRDGVVGTACACVVLRKPTAPLSMAHSLA